MSSSERIDTERSDAKQQGEHGKTSQLTEITVAGPFVEVLIGGPYEKYKYGHVALRVVAKGKDTVYDFGRYGEVWGVGGSQGEGMLNVWSDGRDYINREVGLKRLTLGYVYNMTDEQVQGITVFFDACIASYLTASIGKNGQKVYRLSRDYEPTTHNGTTVTIDAYTASGKLLFEDGHKYCTGAGLNVVALATPFLSEHWSRIFMPADLAGAIEANQNKYPYSQKNKYGSGEDPLAVFRKQKVLLEGISRAGIFPF